MYGGFEMKNIWKFDGLWEGENYRNWEEVE